MPVDTNEDPLELALRQASAGPVQAAAPVPPRGFVGATASTGTPASRPNPQPAQPAAPPPRPRGVDGIVAGARDLASRAGNYLTRGGPAAVAQRVGEDLKSGQEAVGASFIRAPGQMIGGGLDTYADIGRTLGESILPQFVRNSSTQLRRTVSDFAGATAPAAILSIAGGAPSMAPAIASVMRANPRLSGQRLQGTTSVGLADVLSMRETLGRVGNEPLNQGATVTLATAIPMLFGGAFKTAAAGGAAVASHVTLPTRMALAGAGMAIGENPHGEAHAALISRLGNAGLGAAFEFGGEMALRALGGAYRALFVPAMTNAMRPAGTITRGTPADAARDALDRTHAAIRTEDARYAAAAEEHARAMAAIAGDAEGASVASGPVRAGEPPGVGPGVSGPDGGASAASPDGAAAAEASPIQDVGPGTRHVDARPPASEAAGPGGADEASLTPGASPEDAAIVDGNAILARAGVEEQVLPGTPLTPDGRIPVSPEAKAALDRLGWGRAFADVNERIPPHVILMDTAADGTARVVGRMASHDLDDLVQDIMNYASDGEGMDLGAGDIHGQWRMANLGATYDVPGVLRAIVDRVGELSRPMDDRTLMREGREVADALGMDWVSFQQFAAHLTGGNAERLPTAIVALRTVWKRMGEEVDFHAANWASAPTPENQAELLRSIYNTMAGTVAMEDAKTAFGRGLRAFSLPDADTYLSQPLREIAEEAPPTPAAPDGPAPLPRTVEELNQWIARWNATADNPMARTMLLQGLTWTPQKWRYLRSSFANFFTAAIISAPRTLALNVISPVIISGARALERMGGASMAALNPFTGATWAARQELLRVAADTPVAYLTAMADIGDAFRIGFSKLRQEAPSNLWDGYNPIRKTFGVSGNPKINPMDINHQGIPQALIEAAQQGWTGHGAYYLGNVINTFPQWMHSLNGGVNELAQRLAYAGEVRAHIYQEVRRRGLTGSDASEFIRESITNSIDDASGYGMNQAARESSLRTVMLNPLGGGGNGVVAQAARVIQTLRAQVPETRYILPIFQVPANGLGETLRRLPGIGGMFRESAEELSGQHGTIRMAEAYGRQMMGASLLLWGALAARSGIITGAGPSDPGDRRLWSLTHQPYSIRVGDQWFAYNRIDLIGPLMGITATWNDRSVHRNIDQQGAAITAMGSLAEFFRDQAALRGVSDLMSFGNDTNSQQAFIRNLQRIPGGFIPNFITTLTRRNVDPYAREVRSPIGMEGTISGLAIGAMESMLNALPGGSDTLDPVRNLLGEEVMGSNTAAFNLLPLTTAPANTYARDPILDELDRGYQVTGYAPGVAAPVTGGMDMRDVDLEDGRSLYDAIMRYRTISRDANGRTLREALTVLFESPEYNQAQDASAGRAQDDDDQSSRQYLIRQVFTEFNRVARQDVARASPLAAQWLATAEAKDHNPARLNAYSTQQLATEPGLLSALGIPMDRHLAHVRGE